MSPVQIIVGLAIALALSMGGNATLGWLWLGARDDVARAETQREQAAGAAQACSEGTEKLMTLAAENKKLATAMIADAEAKARSHSQRADAILATAPSHPGDDCKSASVRLDSWWKARK